MAVLGQFIKRTIKTLALGTLLTLAAVAQAETEVIVVNAQTPAWEEHIERYIQRANRFLAPAFTGLPSSVRIVRTFRAPEYDLSSGVILIDQNYTPVELYHEYAHKVLDHLLLQRSEAVQYYHLRRTLHGKDLQVALDDLKDELSDDRLYLQELKSNGYQKMVNNLSRSIGWNEQLMDRLQQAQGQHLRFNHMYPHYNGETGKPSLYRLIAPYHELFADTLATLMTGQWDSIYWAQNHRLQQGEEQLAFMRLHPEMSQQQFLAYRRFQRELDLRHYQFKAEEWDSPYTQFAPARSHIRTLAETAYRDQPAQLLYNLADAIIVEIDGRLAGNESYQLTLMEKNRQLIKRLR